MTQTMHHKATWRGKTLASLRKVIKQADPDVVEVSLTAKQTQAELLAGKPTNVYAYNGVMPGGLLREDYTWQFTVQGPEVQTVRGMVDGLRVISDNFFLNLHPFLLHHIIKLLNIRGGYRARHFV